MRLLSSRHIFIGVLVFLTLGINAIVAYFNIAQLAAGSRQIARTVGVVTELENVAGQVKDAESAGRSFVLTGQQTFAENFRSARSDLSVSLKNLDAAVADEQQRARLPGLKSAVAARLEVAARGLSLRRQKGLSAASAYIEGGAGARENARIEQIVAAMRAREGELLEARTTDANQAADDATRTFYIETGVTFGFLGLIWFLLSRAARQNRQLKGAYDELQRAEAMRDSLTAMLVHDLRTPLTGLLGPLQMLESQMLGPLDPTQREVVQISHRSGERLLGMVNALLDVAKMEAGEFTIRPEIIEVAPLLQRVSQAARPLDDDDSAAISIECDLPEVRADPDLLERVLINLVGNALKFTPASGQIILAARKSGEKSRFEVRDTGPGIAREWRERIFEKFGQVENREAGAKFSTGLGLTFCKLAVQAHTGEIGVDSEVGVGSVFWLEI